MHISPVAHLRLCRNVHRLILFIRIHRFCVYFSVISRVTWTFLEVSPVSITTVNFVAGDVKIVEIPLFYFVRFSDFIGGNFAI